MQIREATIADAENIQRVYLQAFHNSEAKIVSDLAVKLLKDKHAAKIISLVAIMKNKIAGHVAFSPVLYENSSEHFGYILAPLAVSPEFQKNNMGSSLVRYGLDILFKAGSYYVFVYGDPQYYSRFGFKTGLADKFIPPHTLQYPEGWQALKLSSHVIAGNGKIKCVDALNDPELW